MSAADALSECLSLSPRCPFPPAGPAARRHCVPAVRGSGGDRSPRCHRARELRQGSRMCGFPPRCAAGSVLLPGRMSLRTRCWQFFGRVVVFRESYRCCVITVEMSVLIAEMLLIKAVTSRRVFVIILPKGTAFVKKRH